jgi:TATA-box binding protein (TBP) (component of TFIID and TFIIIB)
VGALSELVIVNIVAATDLHHALNLHRLCLTLPNAEMSEGGGNWLRLRLEPGNHYAAFYKSGKFLNAGCRSMDDLKQRVNQVLGLLKGHGVATDSGVTAVVNMVVTAQINSSRSLEHLYVELRGDYEVEFEPEQFGGMVISVGKCKIPLFHSGKMVCTGAPTLADAREACTLLAKRIGS